MWVRPIGRASVAISTALSHKMNQPTLVQCTAKRTRTDSYVGKLNVNPVALRDFLVACPQHDWRRSISSVTGASGAREVQEWALATMRSKRAFLQPEELRAVLRETIQDAPTEGIEWMVDNLLVLQAGAVVNDLVTLKYDDFDCNSVPEGMFWRKNSSRSWPTQCLPDRFGWISDTVSIRDLIATLLRDKSAARFARTMGFTAWPNKPNSGYGPMFFMFYTERQLKKLDGVIFFRPFWKPPTIVAELEQLFEKRASQGTLEKCLPDMWTVDPDAWRATIAYFKQAVDELDDDPSRVKFLEFSIKFCKPMWDAEHIKRSVDPRWHAVAACRHLLDQWFGANHLFMGDGFTWSEDRVKGHAEWLISSFENLDCERVSIFPE